MNEVLRQEKKYLINTVDIYRISGLFKQVLAEDSHNGEIGYPVRSLYFDTLFDRDYYEKEDGILLRRKLRLRTYSPKNTFAMLEMKQKEGPYEKKRSLRVSKDDALRLTEGDYSPLLKYREPFALECYAMMNERLYRPKTVVEYRRQAFVAKENKIRITIDRNIEATELDYNIFDEGLNMYPVLDSHNAVLEVKFNGFLLSYIRNLVATVNKSEISISKYTLARRVGKELL